MPYNTLNKFKDFCVLKFLNVQFSVRPFTFKVIIDMVGFKFTIL